MPYDRKTLYPSRPGTCPEYLLLAYSTGCSGNKPRTRSDANSWHIEGEGGLNMEELAIKHRIAIPVVKGIIALASLRVGNYNGVSWVDEDGFEAAFALYGPKEGEVSVADLIKKSIVTRGELKLATDKLGLKPVKTYGAVRYYLLSAVHSRQGDLAQLRHEKLSLCAKQRWEEQRNGNSQRNKSYSAANEWLSRGIRGML